MIVRGLYVFDSPLLGPKPLRKIMTEYRDSIWNNSYVWLDYIDDWTRLNQFGMFEEQENNVVLNENSVERKPCINGEKKSNELTI